MKFNLILVNMSSIDIVNLRHIYAPEKPIEVGHVCMPTANLVAMARLEAAGVLTQFFDENLAPYQPQSEKIAVGLVGAPSIPVLFDFQDDLSHQKLIVGGQVLDSFTASEYPRLFGNRSIVNGNHDDSLSLNLDFASHALLPPESVSLIPAFEKIPEKMLIEYLNNEIPFYLSQGCKYGCSFCPAQKKTPERYRNLDSVEKDLEWLVKKAVNLFDRGHLKRRSLSFYLSNLATFQTPEKLSEFADRVKRVREKYANDDGQEFEINMRGLATVRGFFYLALKEKDLPDHQSVIRKLVDAGFDTVGFGIDGMTAAVWESIKKGHNYKTKHLAILDQVHMDEAGLCVEVTRLAREYGMTPELLMVFGHPKDTEKSMSLAYDFLKRMMDEYKAIPRPQVVKPYPGNDHWNHPSYRPLADSIIRHPRAFQTLDFVGLANPLSHPDPEFRKRVNYWMNQMCTLESNASLPIIPVKPDLRPGGIVQKVRDEAWQVMLRKNLGRYDR